MALARTGQDPAKVFRNRKAVAQIMRGGRPVWTAESLADRLELDRASRSALRVVFAGSSTTQGYAQPQNETYTHTMSARLVRHVLGANAHKMVKKTSGREDSPTSKGFHFLNIGLGGTTAANYIDNDRGILLAYYNPNVIIHMVGSNDYFEQRSPETYKDDVKAEVARRKTATHVLVHTYRREDRDDTGFTWAQYGQALKEAADESENTYFVDVSQDWQDRRDGASDWLQGDKVHTTQKGAEALAEAVADAIGLDTHTGETVWAFDGAELPDDGKNNVSAMEPTSESLVQLPAKQSDSGKQPVKFKNGDLTALSFNLNGANYLDTDGFGAAYSFPMTFYVVAYTFSNNTSHGTLVQPWFSRSVDNDDGWWWAWRDRGSTEVRAALNSAFSPPANYGVNNFPLILAVHMTSASRAKVWANSREPFGTIGPDRVSETPGPWMKSLRIGANSNAASYMGGRYYEMRWELSDMNTDSVTARMEQLGEKYGVELD